MRYFAIFILLLSLSFAYTNGSGTIQNCQTFDYDYCTVTANSTISNSDFNLTNRETIINTNVIITMQSSRLFINSTERIWVKSGAYILGDGFVAAPTNTGIRPHGGSGGSCTIAQSGTPRDNDGVRNGADGTVTNSGICTIPIAGNGSGLTPYEITSGAIGTGDSTNEEATGGGTYATGGIFGTSSGSCAGGCSGGSGQAIKLTAAKIQIDGTISVDGGNGNAGSNAKGGAGGSGGGELILYFAYLNNTGTIQADGGDGDVACGSSNCFANGGTGGMMRFYSKIQNVSTGTITTAGGTCQASGSDSCTNGASGNATYATSTAYYPDIVLGMYNTTGDSFSGSTQEISFRLWVLNSSNVSCYYTLAGTTTSLGTYNYTTDITTYAFNTTQYDGSYYLNVSCNNTSPSIATVYSDTIYITVTGNPAGGGGSSGGGGGGTSGIYTAPSESQEQETQETQETPPPVLSETEYYENPPSSVGQGANIADAIVEVSGGAIDSLPYTCQRTFEQTFAGLSIFDTVACEWKGILSLYVKRIGTFVNFAMVVLIALAISTHNQQEKKGAWFWGKTILLIGSFILGFDFLTFSLTALIVKLQGLKL